MALKLAGVVMVMFSCICNLQAHDRTPRCALHCIVYRTESEEAMAKGRSERHKVKVRKEKEREQKWRHMMANWNAFRTQTRKQAKLKSRIRKGIPHALRAEVWKRLTGVNDMKAQQPSLFDDLALQTPDKVWKKVIDHDLDRTFPEHCMFSNDNGRYG